MLARDIQYLGVKTALLQASGLGFTFPFRRFFSWEKSKRQLRLENLNPGVYNFFKFFNYNSSEMGPILEVLVKLIGVNKGRHVTLKYFNLLIKIHKEHSYCIGPEQSISLILGKINAWADFWAEFIFGSFSVAGCIYCKLRNCKVCKRNNKGSVMGRYFND